ncbi:probable RNA-binding protein CG14230 [Anopheles bellator]|uniref:probable RNA-binding protein CG14230 n=1 Tax=Anopheles bellator TaxID=139047 RepID=UPI002649D30A|nr:probable RNA-binding protein CG14230 [Anopheles bellator]
MIMKSHRLFVGNIPAGVSEKELSDEFSAYGVVESVEIKSKPNALSGAVDTFGFLSLSTDDKIVSQCIKEFREQQYRGVYLNVSKAKESFLDRLKREREEAESQKQNALSLDPYRKEAEDDQRHTAPTTVQLPTLPSLGKDDEVSSSESSEDSASEEEGREPVRKAPAASKTPQEELVKKWNQETYIEHGKLKIIPITGQVTEVIDRTKPHQRSEGKQLSEQARIADEKRKQGLTKLNSAYEQQQLAIKSALSKTGSGSNRKIAFDDDEEGGERQSGTKRKLSLFGTAAEEDDDGFEGNFKVRKQLSGSEGKELYEMQTSFQADNRFRLDDRFLERNGNEASSRNTSKDKAADKERLKQLEILSNVTGKPVASEKRNERHNKLPQMQRFDPSQKRGDPTEKNRLPASETEKVDPLETDYKVSDEKFYTVSDGLAGLLAASSDKKERNEGFSLRTMFGRDSGPADETTEGGQRFQRTEPKDSERPKDSGARFKHESSESEEEPEASEPIRKDPKGRNRREVDDTDQRKAGYYARQGIWKEKFFFLPNDSRFDEGRQFFALDTSASCNERPVEGQPDGAENEGSTRQQISKIYKKRRQREGKTMKMKSKLGIRVAKDRKNAKK